MVNHHQPPGPVGPHQGRGILRLGGLPNIVYLWPDKAILLVEEIWDTIAEENQAFELTNAQKQELDRRLESVRTNPGHGRTWDEIKAEFMKSR